MEYKNLDKDARKCMFVGTLMGTLILAAIISIGYYFGREFLGDYIGVVNTIVIIIGVLSILNLLISPHFRFKRYKYMITDDKIDVVEGYIFIKREIVPIERIHKITLERGPIDNIYGLAKVLLTTAGGVVTIQYLKLEKAEQIAESLKSIVNEVAS